jgi:hypothetical protein
MLWFVLKPVVLLIRRAVGPGCRAVGLYVGPGSGLWNGEMRRAGPGLGQ